MAPLPNFNEVMTAAGIGDASEVIANEDEQSTFDPIPDMVSVPFPNSAITCTSSNPPG